MHSKNIGRTQSAETRDRTGDLQIFSPTLSQLSYRGLIFMQLLCTSCNVMWVVADIWGFIGGTHTRKCNDVSVCYLAYPRLPSSYNPVHLEEGNDPVQLNQSS